MIPLTDVQAILAERGIRFSIRALQRWARRGDFGAIMGRRERRYFMRRRLVLRLLHTGRA